MRLAYMMSIVALSIVLFVVPAFASNTDTSDRERLDNGVQLHLWVGGWEPDYTKEAHEGMISYKGVDRLHLYAGYGYADQIYYERQKVYAKGYYFYTPRAYMKLNVTYKDYDYPDDPDIGRPNPDSNAYDTVPSAEFEISQWLSEPVRATVFYEYIRPTFFHDSDAYAENHKIGADVYYITPLQFLRAKVIFALLRDPDPEETEIQGRDNPNTSEGTATETDIVYRTSFLLGGGLELVLNKWEAELKILPNRDLDNSYDYSLLTNVSYRFTDKLTGRLDYVYDKYSSESNFADETAHVYMASGFYEITARIKIGAGYKHLDLPDRTEDTGFVSLQFKTGLL
jgi:hypothetical protein